MFRYFCKSSTVSIRNYKSIQLRPYSTSSLSNEEIKKRLITILHHQLKIVHPEKASAEITEKTNFKRDLNLDSLDLVETVMAIEEEFSIEVRDSNFEPVKTIKNAIDFIKNTPAK